MKVLITEKLESLLQTKWTDFLDRQQLMRLSLEYARDAAYKTLRQKAIPKIQISMTVTQFKLTDNPDSAFEVWLEFSVPKDTGVIVGTHVLSLSLTGEVKLKETYGTHFVIET